MALRAVYLMLDVIGSFLRMQSRMLTSIEIHDALMDECGVFCRPSLQVKFRGAEVKFCLHDNADAIYIYIDMYV